MTKYIAAAAIAIGLVFASSAQAAAPHCYPYGCDYSWHVFTGAKLGLPNTVSNVTDAQLRKAASNAFSDYHGCCESLSSTYDGAYAPVAFSQSRTSSTSGYVYVIHDYKWAYTPARITRIARRSHQFQADYGNFAAGHWRVRAVSHGG
jgi:hypothetical protein